MSNVRRLMPQYEASEMNEVREKLGVLTAKADAAHNRIDRLETGIKSDLVDIQKDLKELTAHMHQGKGWNAAFSLMAGLAGAGIVKLLAMVFGT